MKNCNYTWIIGSRLHKVQAAFCVPKSSLHFNIYNAYDKNQPKQQ